MNASTKATCHARRRRGSLAVSLALAGMATLAPAAHAAPQDCLAGTPGCVQLGGPSMPVPAVPAQPPEAGRSRGVFLATFARALVPGLVSGIDAWLRSKLNVPMQGGPGDPMPGGSGAGNYRPQEMPGMAPGMMPGMMPGYGPVGGNPPGPMPMPMYQGPMPGSMQAQAQGQMVSSTLAPPMPAPQMPAPQMPAPQMPPDDGLALQAGVAYQVSLVGRDGNRTLVDPSQRSFGTGERILLAFRTNLPGLVEVYNIDTTGREELIDQQQMSAGQLANLGPYEFVNLKGEETLRIVLRPCLGGDGNPATRGMVRVQINPELGNRMQACDDPAMRQQPTGTRGIAKVQLEGGTNFALDPLSRSEIDSGRLEPREVRVRFLHR